MPLLDPATRNEIAVEVRRPRERTKAACGRGQGKGHDSCARATTDDHDVQAVASSLDSTTQPRKLELTLAYGNEDERRFIRSLHRIALEPDSKGTHARKAPHHRQGRRKPVPKPRL